MGLSRSEAGLLAVTAVALAATLIGLSALEGARAPTTAGCIADWNERAAPSQLARATQGAFGLADVQGWLAKLSYPGCGILFVRKPGQPYLSCTRTFRAADSRLTAWTCEGGRRWGRGPSAGSDFEPDARVGSQGRLSLAASPPLEMLGSPPQEHSPRRSHVDNYTLVIAEG
jgi:hypothetical protein